MNRDFKGIWIDKSIWLNKDLTLHEKMFLVEIDSLDNEDGCYATNAHFSEFFGVTKGRCTQIIKSLEAKNLVNITLKRSGKQVVKRTIKVVNKLNRVVNKLNNPIKNIKYPYLENAQGNNTSINNTKVDIYALDFLKENHQLVYEQLLMAYKKQILDWEYFVKCFNAVCEKEDLEFKARIIKGRFIGYASTWIYNANKKLIQDKGSLTPSPQFKKIK